MRGMMAQLTFYNLKNTRRVSIGFFLCASYETVRAPNGLTRCLVIDCSACSVLRRNTLLLTYFLL